MSNYPELLADVSDNLHKRLKENGIDEQQSRKIAFEHVEFIRKHWGGQPIYIPKGIAHDLTARDIEMFKKFNGHNQDALAREYSLTVVRVYQILKIAQAEFTRKHQTDIFGQQ